MATYADISDAIIDWIEDDSQPDSLRRTINHVLRQLTGQRKFDALQETKIITPDESGIFTLPPLCRQITDVRATENNPTERRFKGATASLHMEGPTELYDRLIPVGVDTTFDQKNIEFETTETTRDTLAQAVGSDNDIPDNIVGHRVKVIGIHEDYEVLTVTPAAQITIRPEYTPRTPLNGIMHIGNYGLRKYCLEDCNGNPYTSEITLHYQRYHPRLLHDEDLLLTDIPNTLILSSVQRLMKIFKYDIDSLRLRGELEQAMAAEMGQEVINNTHIQRRPSLFTRGTGIRWRSRTHR